MMADLSKYTEKSLNRVNEIIGNKDRDKAMLLETAELMKSNLEVANNKVAEALRNGNNEEYLQALNEQRTAQDNIRYSEERINMLDAQPVSNENAGKEIDALASEIEKASIKELGYLLKELNGIIDRLKEFKAETDRADNAITSWASACGTDYPSSAIPYCQAKDAIKSFIIEYTTASGYDGKSKLLKYEEILKA